MSRRNKPATCFLCGEDRPKRQLKEVAGLFICEPRAYIVDNLNNFVTYWTEFSGNDLGSSKKRNDAVFAAAALSIMIHDVWGIDPSYFLTGVVQSVKLDDRMRDRLADAIINPDDQTFDHRKKVAACKTYLTRMIEDGETSNDLPDCPLSEGFKQGLQSAKTKPKETT